MRCRPELLKSFANDLAKTVISDRVGVASLLRLTGLFAQPSSAAPSTPSADGGNGSAAATNPDQVGIWERKLKDGKSYFVRRIDMMGDWNYWANVGRINPKAAKRRVVLIGESVARGYFYDPQFTPAMALKEILQSRLGAAEVEVVDLARTNLYMKELLDLARSALALEPDAVVFLAGNNWRLTLLDNIKSFGVRDIISLLREGGIAGMKRYAEEQLAAEIRQLVREIAALYEANNVLPVWIIPEFNLADWRDPATNAPHLPNSANREWIEHFEGARQALQNADPATASRLASKMVELDHGATLAGWYILADCHRQMGDQEAARECLERARDALIWDPSRMVSPRSYSVVQETLRDEVTQCGNGLVDLPRNFKEHLKGELPDRRVFLDYCHLTSEGIRIAMAGTAACLLRLFKGVETEWQELATEMSAPAREVEGEAAFLAAVHNAHWWQADDLVDYYCARSVEASPKIAQVMTDYIDLETRRAPMLMCRAAEQIAKLGSPLVQQYLLRHSNKQLDKSLLSAVVGALKGLGIDEGQRLNQLRQQEHSVTRADVNLLDLYYCTTVRQPQEIRWVTPYQIRPEVETDYYKAYWLESRFVFVGEANSPVRLNLTCRLPGPGASEQPVSIEVNGKPVGELAVGRKWEAWEILIDGDVILGGLNEVALRWPLPEFPGEAAFETATDDMVHGIYPSLFPVFGEIHSFVATDGRRHTANGA